MLEQQDAIKILTHPLLEEVYPEVLQMIRLSRKFYAYPQAAFEIQTKFVLPRLIQIEKALSSAKEAGDHTYPYKYLNRIYKWIVDGLALRYLGFNPNAYRILSDNRTPGGIIKSGQQTELKELEILASAGKLAILADLTHFIRIGDIAIFRQKGRYLELREIKSKPGRNSEKKEKASLQEKRMRSAESMINEHICVLNGKKSNIELLPIYAKTYLNAVRGAMVKAERDGVSYVDVDSSVKLVVLDFLSIHRLGIDVEKTLLSKGLQALPEKHQGGQFMSIDLAWAEHGEFARGVFPPTVLRLPTRLLADMICGKKLVTVYFDFTNFCSKFEQLGFEVDVDTTPWNIKLDEAFNKRTMPLEKSRPPAVITLKKGSWHMELPETLLPRIFYEYLHPDAVIELVKYTYAGRYTRPLGYSLPLFKNHVNLYR